jgi:hypothetical protein
MSHFVESKILDKLLKRRLLGADPIDTLLEDQLIENALHVAPIDQESNIIMTKLGIVSKRNRKNYARRPKKS